MGFFLTPLSCGHFVLSVCFEWCLWGSFGSLLGTSIRCMIDVTRSISISITERDAAQSRAIQSDAAVGRCGALVDAAAP